MRIDILTIFPQYFKTPLECSILKIAQEKKLLKINIYNPREYTDNANRQVDDSPYGGGPGMVMMIEPFYKTLVKITKRKRFNSIKKQGEIILLSPKGKPLNTDILKRIAKKDRLILICGRYEGVDERIRGSLTTEEISIGDYVMSGGETAALVLLEALARLIPGVLGAGDSLKEESFSGGLLEYPQYTRPEVFKGLRVPKILLSGDHEKIRQWRIKSSIIETINKRKDLINMEIMNEETKKIYRKIRKKKS